MTSKMSNPSAHIVIGITGGIAAYKTLSLIRLLKKAGHEVKVVATRHAMDFVTPLTLQTLSQNKVCTDLFEPTQNFEVEHVALAEWADMMVVAPASANIIGKFANGIADDMLSTLFLAFSKPVFLAPAMNKNMWVNPAVQHNIGILKDRNCHILAPASGFLACGTDGEGRMQEPEDIFQKLFEKSPFSTAWNGKKVLVTAGPTYEPIDPVRFVGNYSSGLMGMQLAQKLAEQGAKVTLVCGPTHLSVNHCNIIRVNVSTADEMLRACLAAAPESELIIMAAAVADYTPALFETEKIKKTDSVLNLSLKKTVDILATLGMQRAEKQCIVGFALETENEIDNAREKLQNKHIDIIVLNSLRNEGAGFQCKTNQVTIMDKNGKVQQGTLKGKEKVADDIIHYIADYLKITTPPLP